MPKISVVVRIKPSHTGDTVLETRSESISVNENIFAFPQQVITGSDQLDVYDKIFTRNKILDKIAAGYSFTLFSYGQTGSGKTYTMLSPQGCLTESCLAKSGGKTPDSWGLLPRVMMQLLDDPNIKVSASAIEIYGDAVFDLLDNRKMLSLSKATGARIRDRITQQNGTIHPSSCSCMECFNSSTRRNLNETRPDFFTSGSTGAKPTLITSPQQIAQFARTIELTRIAAPHKINDRSSRSHCLIQLDLTRIQKDTRIQKNLLLFIDLV
jgi:hypothetical protein